MRTASAATLATFVLLWPAALQAQSTERGCAGALPASERDDEDPCDYVANLLAAGAWSSADGGSNDSITATPDDVDVSGDLELPAARNTQMRPVAAQGLGQVVDTSGSAIGSTAPVGVSGAGIAITATPNDVDVDTVIAVNLPAVLSALGGTDTEEFASLSRLLDVSLVIPSDFSDPDPDARLGLRVRADLLGPERAGRELAEMRRIRQSFGQVGRAIGMSAGPLTDALRRLDARERERATGESGPTVKDCADWLAPLLGQESLPETFHREAASRCGMTSDEVQDFGGSRTELASAETRFQNAVTRLRDETQRYSLGTLVELDTPWRSLVATSDPGTTPLGTRFGVFIQGGGQFGRAADIARPANRTERSGDGTSASDANTQSGSRSSVERISTPSDRRTVQFGIQGKLGLSVVWPPGSTADPAAVALQGAVAATLDFNLLFPVKLAVGLSGRYHTDDRLQDVGLNPEIMGDFLRADIGLSIAYSRSGSINLSVGLPITPQGQPVFMVTGDWAALLRALASGNTG